MDCVDALCFLAKSHLEVVFSHKESFDHEESFDQETNTNFFKILVREGAHIAGVSHDLFKFEINFPLFFPLFFMKKKC